MRPRIEPPAGAVVFAAILSALLALGCGDATVEPSAEPAVPEKPTVLKGTAHPGPAAREPAGPPAELVEKCKVFEPPWGAGSWIEWGQSNPEEGEKWYTSIGDTMKNADLTVLPQCQHLKNVFVGMSSLTDLSPLAGLTGIERLDLRFIEELSDLSPLTALVNLEYLNISGTGVTDLSPLAKLPKLAELEARTLKLTDASAVSGMKPLRKVDFLKTPLTDLAPLAKAPLLAEILVCNTKVETLEPLFGVTDRIRALDLCGTKFEDYDVLARFDQLTALRLSRKPIADLKPIAGMTRMKKLDINGTKVTDLTPIERMTAMEQLDLSELEVKSLEPLYGMKQLKKLYVVKSKIDKTEIDKLKRALPDVEVFDEYGI